MKITSFQVISLIAVLFAYFGCTKAIIDEGTTPDINREVKYNPDIQAIMFNHCTTCHGGPAPNAGVSLITYEEVRFFSENGKLEQRVNDVASPMPPSGLLSAEQRELIRKWIADGFPEQ